MADKPESGAAPTTTTTTEQPRCADCNCAAPDLDQEQTLRSALGWRLVFERQADGTNKSVWRCPDCWAKYKKSKSV